MNKILRQNHASVEDISKVDFILDRYMYYFTEAIKHSIIVHVAKLFCFRLAYITVKSIPERLLKKVILTKRLFGHHFIMVVESKMLKENGYLFKSDLSLNNKITDELEGDNLYKLIK
jgi:hypothetical protein